MDACATTHCRSNPVAWLSRVTPLVAICVGIRCLCTATLSRNLCRFHWFLQAPESRLLCGQSQTAQCLEIQQYRPCLCLHKRTCVFVTPVSAVFFCLGISLQVRCSRGLRDA